MRKFIKNILTLTLIYLIVNLVVYHLLLKDLIFNEYLNLSSNSKNYVLSDSHGEAISDEQFASIGISNLSFASDSYFDIYFKVCSLINNKEVDTLYITVDDHTLSPYREKMNNLDRSIYFGNFSDYSDFLPMSRFQFIINRSIGMYLPLIDTKKSMLIYETLKSSLKLKKNNTTKENQWAETTSKKTKIHQRKELQFKEKNASKKLTKCLLQIIDICNKNNVVLIGLKFPITTAYSKEIKELSYNPDKIMNNHGLMVIDLKDGFKDQLFKDQDHLNELGSIFFIKQLSSKISKLNSYLKNK